MAYIAMAYIVMAYIAMAYVVMAYLIMAVDAAPSPRKPTVWPIQLRPM